MPSTTKKTTLPQSKGAIELMLTAEKLFGERGIDGVSLRQIVTAAGQANSSAVQHHFGTKEGLIQAVFDMRLPALDNGRMQRLDNAKDKTGYISVPQLLSALYTPVIEDMTETTQKSFALFNSQLMQVDLASHPFMRTKQPQPAYMEIFKRLEAHFDYLPSEVFQLRMRLASELFFGALNERRRLDQSKHNPYPSPKPYWDEILQAIEALFRLPYTGNASAPNAFK